MAMTEGKEGGGGPEVLPLVLLPACQVCREKGSASPGLREGGRGNYSDVITENQELEEEEMVVVEVPL